MAQPGAADTTQPLPDSGRDHGALPDWRTGDLPEPLPFSFRNAIRTIGPGAILLAGSIGGGEWIVGPLMAVKYGREILWIATIGIALQMVFNLEAARYTLYTGEPILTGIMRLAPGSKLWSTFYTIVGVVQLAVPAMALGCANVIFASFASRLADPSGGDASTLLWISYGIMAATVLLLLSGKSIERVLERLSWVMIVLIFGFLILVNVLFVSPSDWMGTITGFVTPSAIPQDMDYVLLGLFAATAGAGGLGNLAISNWIRDKGFGMGGHMGGIGGVLSHDHVELESTGMVFQPTEKNLDRWKHWWNYVLVDQSVVWAFGCLFGMFLNVNLAAAIVPADADLSGYAAGAFQAQHMADQLWSGFWFLCLMNGFWVLLSTHIANTDGLTRTVSDIAWAAYPKVKRWSSSRVYAVILGFVVLWGVVALAIGENALSLFKILGILASPIMAIAAVQMLRINTRFLPEQIRPPLWRKVALGLCAAFYGTISGLLVYDTFWN